MIVAKRKLMRCMTCGTKTRSRTLIGVGPAIGSANVLAPECDRCHDAITAWVICGCARCAARSRADAQGTADLAWGWRLNLSNLAAAEARATKEVR